MASRWETRFESSPNPKLDQRCSPETPDDYRAILITILLGPLAGVSKNDSNRSDSNKMIQIEVIQLNSLLAPSSADYEHSDMRPVQTE